MVTSAFVTSFTGKALAGGHATSVSHQTPKCAMASDSVAPVIKLYKTELERQNSISVAFEKISVSLAEADAITSNSALTATLLRKSKGALPSTSSAKPEIPVGVSTEDFYFPVETRNLAPNICLNTSDNSLYVNYEIVQAEVGGIASTSEKEVPFWKKPAPGKWTAPSTDSSSYESETISTALFEKYFPSSVRNLAPEIKMRAPENCLFNELPYLQVSSEFVPFNPKLNEMVVLPELPAADQEEELPLAAASTIMKYYPDDVIHLAPNIEINEAAESVGVCMETVSGEKGVADILAKYQ